LVAALLAAGDRWINAGGVIEQVERGRIGVVDLQRQGPQRFAI